MYLNLIVKKTNDKIMPNYQFDVNESTQKENVIRNHGGSQKDYYSIKLEKDKIPKFLDALYYGNIIEIENNEVVITDITKEKKDKKDNEDLEIVNKQKKINAMEKLMVLEKLQATDPGEDYKKGIKECIDVITKLKKPIKKDK